MRRKVIRILLIFSSIVIVLLFQPKFHKPPIEIQDRVYRLIIEYSFITSIGLAMVCGFILIKVRLLRALYTILGSVIMFLVFFGFIFTWMNDGNTYLDTNYFKSDESDKLIIKQYYDHGAFGSSSRYIIRNNITHNISWFRLVDKVLMKSKLTEVDSNGNEILSFEE